MLCHTCREPLKTWESATGGVYAYPCETCFGSSEPEHRRINDPNVGVFRREDVHSGQRFIAEPGATLTEPARILWRDGLLVPPEALDALIAVLAFGAAKYAPDGWRTQHPDRETFNRENAMAFGRHIEPCFDGAFSETYWDSDGHTLDAIDPESRLPHLWHAFARLAFLIAGPAK